MNNSQKSDGIDCGEYLGNGVIQLNMTGAVGLEHKGITTFTDRAICIAPHRVLMKYGSEGNIIWNY